LAGILAPLQPADLGNRQEMIRPPHLSTGPRT
jgi:hypothetical protein